MSIFKKLENFMFFIFFFVSFSENVWTHNDFDHILIKRVWTHMVFVILFVYFSENVGKHNGFDAIGFTKLENTLLFQLLPWKCIKMSNRRLDMRHSGRCFTSRQNELQKARFDVFRPWLHKSTKWAPEGSIWGIFRPWLQKSTKWAPQGSIWGIPVLAPEVDKMSS